MRLFVALPLPPPFVRSLLTATEKLRETVPALRWEGQAKLHLTLAFLGEVDSTGVGTVVEAARRTAAGCASFRLGARGILCLPRRPPHSVLAVSIGEGRDVAAAAARRFEDEYEAIGRELRVPTRPRERRPFTAHITLARAGPRGLRLTEEDRGLRVDTGCTIEGLGVYESLLGPEGSRYSELVFFPFFRPTA